jgi:hypothetical protein
VEFADERNSNSDSHVIDSDLTDELLIIIFDRKVPTAGIK